MTDITAATFVLAVKDLDTSKRFYVEKLGFVEDLAVDGWSFLSRGACTFRLGHCPEVIAADECQDHSWFAYLHVSDAGALFAEYSAAGVPIWHQLEDKPWGLREFGVVTPDGHKIVFGQEIDA